MNYTIDSFDINTLGRSGMTSISCRVKGFWSSDTIRVYLQREYIRNGGDWKASVSYGSGGRDTKDVVSDTEACRYFAEALTAMCDLADQLIAQKDKLEAAYQQQAAELSAARTAAEQAKQAKIEADPALGLAKARAIVSDMLAKGYCTVSMFARGEDRPQNVSLITGAKSVFYINSNRVGKADVINALATASVRTTFAN